MKTATKTLDFPGVTVHSNLSTAMLVEASLREVKASLHQTAHFVAIQAIELVAHPNDKFVEDTPGIHDAIALGQNKPTNHS